MSENAANAVIKEVEKTKETAKKEKKAINLRDKVEVTLIKDGIGKAKGDTVITHPENLKYYEAKGLIAKGDQGKAVK